MHVEVKSRSTMNSEDTTALRSLSRAVYPPEANSISPARPITWSQPEYSIFVHDDTGRLVSHIGALIREVTLDGTPVRIGGIGGVMTHPDCRGRGYAAAGMQRAVDFFTTNAEVAFALLVCKPDVAPYYARLGWQPFNGILMVEQPDGRVPFTFNAPMLFPIHAAPPKTGELDLCGLPW